MATGYEVGMYRNIESIDRSLKSIAASLEKLANPVHVMESPPDRSWVQTEPVGTKEQVSNSHTPGCTGCSC